MSRMFRAACLQLCPGNDLGRNLSDISHWMAQAVGKGAEFVALPEFASYLDRDSKSMRSSAALQDQSHALAELRDLARRNAVWMLIGSLVMERDEEPGGRLANRSFLIAPSGKIAASYDKIHLFDATLSDGRMVGESRHYAGGAIAPIVDTPLANFGMSICYDLRFPQLYRALALAGAEIVTIPAAFTAETGTAHWEPLLRARAIETGCYVLAPATVGLHPGNWQTYGHAAIIDPWGRVIAECPGDSSGFCIAEIDPTQSAAVRARIPSLTTNPTFEILRKNALQS